nr:MAG TPA: Exonuclease [Caudoviricetes sp.]
MKRCNPYMSNVDLWRLKTGRKQAQDISSNAHVQYGHDAEGPLRELFALDYPQFEVSYGGAFDMVHNPEHPYIFATLDGRLKEKATGRLGVYEGKTTEILRSMQREKWKDRIPDNYYVQVIHQLIATGWDFAVLNAQMKRVFDGDVRTETRRYFIERAEVQNDIDYLLAEEVKFWTEYVQKDREPPLILPEI